MIDFLNHRHLKESQELFNFISELDFNEANDFFGWKSGGDGDNGEVLLNELDAYFASSDRKPKYVDMLEPCPFCGARASIRLLSIGNNNHHMSYSYSIKCTDCGATKAKQSVVTVSFSVEDGVCVDDSELLDAIADWNRRTNV